MVSPPIPVRGTFCEFESRRWRVTTEESRIKGVCLLTPVLSVGVGGVGHRLRHHRAANALGNSVTQVSHRGSLAGKHSVASS